MIRIPQISEEQAKQFWARVQKGGSDECWPWAYGRFPNQYGCVSINDMSYGSHVIAFALTHGVWPRHVQIMHSCDNRPCCNPAHLSDGTNQDNMLDCIRKGRRNARGQSGSHNNTTALTEEDVREVRRLGIIMSKAAISRLPRFSGRISQKGVSHILANRCWKDVK